MKRFLIMAAIIGFIFLLSGIVLAQENPAVEETTEQKQAVKETVNVAAPSSELIEKKKAELNWTEWTVEMKPMTGKGKPETDVITFADGKVGSKNLVALGGFAPSNFTVRLEDDGTVIWETMQTSEKDGIAFWRGDVKDGIMRGVLSRRDKKDRPTDFNFHSEKSTSIPQTAATPSDTTTATTTTTEQ